MNSFMTSIRDRHHYSSENPIDAELDYPEIIEAKRKWAGEQLAVLEERKLVTRTLRPGRRPQIVALKDDGSGDPFDDPGELAAQQIEGNAYITICGQALADPRFRDWKGPALAATPTPSQRPMPPSSRSQTYSKQKAS